MAGFTFDYLYPRLIAELSGFIFGGNGIVGFGRGALGTRVEDSVILEGILRGLWVEGRALWCACTPVLSCTPVF